MIKVGRGEAIPRFYVPVKHCMDRCETECYLFFIAPFALLYEKIKRVVIRIWDSNIEFVDARKTMNQHLKDDPDLYLGYKANIAMCIYVSRRNDGRLNHSECNEVAEKLIKLIFEG